MRIGKVVLALGVAVLVATPALAQRRGGGGFGQGAQTVGTLVTNTSVKEELKVSEDQQKKIKEAIDKLHEDLKDDYAKVGRGGRRGGGGGGANVTPEERT